MRSQKHAAPETVLGQRRTGGEGSLPCAGVVVSFTAQHPLPLGQLLHSPEVCLRSRGGDGTKAVTCTCVCPLRLVKGSAYLCACPQRLVQTLPLWTRRDGLVYF